MTIIGTDSIPGVKTTVNTANTIGISTEAPTDLCLVGPADLSVGSASPNDVKTITGAQQARDLFGDEEKSMLTLALLDALGEGAYPVFGCAAETVAVDEEDHSSMVGTSGSVTETPMVEDASTITVTVDSTTFTPRLTLENPADATLEGDEAVFNPVRGTLELSAAPSTSATISYETVDYETALDAVADQRADEVDFLTPVQETTDVTTYALQTVNRMVSHYDLAICLAGHDTYVDDMTSVAAGFDDSRMQVAYPSRDREGNTAIGSYAGKKASLGINASAMGKSLDGERRMYDRISVQDEIDLVNARIVPIRSSKNGAVIVDDPTTVADDNAEEAGMRQGYARLVMDRVIDIVHANEQPFIGRLNTPEVRNALRDLLTSMIMPLEDADAVEDFLVQVRERDAMSVDVIVTVDTTDPLRNIYNKILAGQVQNAEAEA